MRPRQGIALVVTVGVLTLLFAAAVAMAIFASRLRGTVNASADGVSARLLARSGVEYASARLTQDASPRIPPSPGNQTDDWTYRAGPGVPLERSLNPSYAQTEPYADLDDNGKYDPSVDAFQGKGDWNSNGRFDAWSGRLKGIRGPWGAAFALKISGENAEGAYNVNSGLLDLTDVNANGIPDFRDLGERAQVLDASGYYRQLDGYSGAVDGYFPFLKAYLRDYWHIGIPDGAGTDDVSIQRFWQQLEGEARKANANAGAQWNRRDLFARNRRVASTLNQLGSILGLVTPRPGDRIVASRPAGGYRSLDEVKDRVGFPQTDWEKIRPCLGVDGRWNRWIPYYVYCAVTDVSITGGIRHPDRLPDLNLHAAPVEIIAALFSGMQFRDQQTYFSQRSGGPVGPGDALRIASFLRQGLFASWFDLYAQLVSNKEGYAELVHALVRPEELGYPYLHGDTSTVGSSQMNSWATYDKKGSTYYQRQFRKIELFDGDSSSTGGGGSLNFNPLSFFSIESLGKTGSPAGGPEFRRRCSCVWQGRGLLDARSQADFENRWVFRRADGRRFTIDHKRFEGGTLVGRPRRDRIATYPCFSRDACPDLLNDSLLDSGDGFFPGEAMSTIGLAAPVAFSLAYTFDYCLYCGELMLSDRSWVDGEAVFYRPLWDLDQPERPGPPPPEFGCHFDDAARGARWTRGAQSGAEKRDPPGRLGGRESVDIKGIVLRTGAVDPCDHADFTPAPTDGYPCFVFEWGDGAPNAAPFPLVHADGGDLAQGTIEGWFGGTVTTDVQTFRFRIQLFNPSSSNVQPPGYGETLEVGRGMWRARDPGGRITMDWHEEAGPAKIDHYAYAFDDSAPVPCVNVYRNGLWRATLGFQRQASDPTVVQRLIDGPGEDSYPLGHEALPVVDELRLYSIALDAARIAVHAGIGRYWSAEPITGSLSQIPSFTSPLYRFDVPTLLTDIAWDGFVPDVLRAAADDWNRSNPENPKNPLCVELILRIKGSEERIVMPLPAEDWRSGGGRVDFQALWRAAHSDREAPEVEALSFRVRMDASMLDLAWETPIFDGIEAGFRMGRVHGIHEE